MKHLCPSFWCNAEWECGLEACTSPREEMCGRCLRDEQETEASREAWKRTWDRMSEEEQAAYIDEVEEQSAAWPWWSR